MLNFLKEAYSMINGMKREGESTLSVLWRLIGRIFITTILPIALPILIIGIISFTLIGVMSYKFNVLRYVDSIGRSYSYSSSSSDSSSTSYPTGSHAAIVEIAKTQLGVPYSEYASYYCPREMDDENCDWRGVGFNCSGFTKWAYKKAGFDIPIAQGYYSYYTGYFNGENSQMWYIESRGHWKNSTSECNPGDLVLYSPVHDKYNTGHVAIYIGNDEIIEADYGGVQISPATTGTFVGCGWPLD